MELFLTDTVLIPSIISSPNQSLVSCFGWLVKVENERERERIKERKIE
jgi:hypothetical protein